MEDVEARFAHLLLPIRDLTRNWEVDVAAQLGEYLEEYHLYEDNCWVFLFTLPSLVMSPELHFS
ncbi:hypothetical protein FD754_014694 [Muntiacus muntjak]|uniref:Condensin-2 complex subunit H2 n=1 Tax=Muntiacus muntjak TaxID=9888 RepID=A0A5N3VKM3_MUNMU|nr:hypothetical protein FD754_014694 [Muntiacus muntjak]